MLHPTPPDFSVKYERALRVSGFAGGLLLLLLGGGLGFLILWAPSDLGEPARTIVATAFIAQGLSTSIYFAAMHWPAAASPGRPICLERVDESRDSGLSMMYLASLLGIPLAGAGLAGAADELWLNGAMAAGGILLLFGLLYFLLRDLTRVRVLCSEPAAVGAPVRLVIEVRALARIRSVSARIIGREEATCGAGTGSTAETVTFFDEPLPLVFAANYVGGAHGTIALPAASLPTFEARSNRVYWVVEVEADIALWPDTKQEHALPVEGPVVEAGGDG